jgi:hypothetical protein
MSLPPPLPDPSSLLHLLLLVAGALYLPYWLLCLVSYIQQLRACLQWWFIKRCFTASAAEPSLSPSPRPPPAWGSLHKYLLLLAFLPTATASDASDLTYTFWSLASHFGPFLMFLWTKLNWMLPWIMVTLSLVAIPILAIVWINKYLYPLVASVARVPARWYFAPILPTILGSALLFWIQVIEQHQPNPSQVTLGRWICAPLYYLFFRGFCNGISNFIDRLLDRLLPFDNYSDLRLSLLPSLEDGRWLHQTIRRPNRKAHDWRRRHGRKPLPPKITVISTVHIPSFGVIIRLIAKLLVYRVAFGLAHRFRGQPSPSINKDSLSPPPWPTPTPEDVFQDTCSHPAHCPNPDYDLDTDLEQSDPDPVSSNLHGTSDEYMMNCASFASEFCSLDDAGFAFTAQHVPLHKSSYRLRRSANFQHFKHQRKAKVVPKPTAASASVPSAPTYDNFLLAYLSTFNPAVVSRVMQDHFVYGYHEAKVSVDLSHNPNGRHPLINALWLLNLRMEHIPLIIDTGASCCITPCKADFKPGSYRSSDIKVRDLSGENQVIGQGTVLWTVKDTRGRKQVIELPALHIPTAKVRLLSPQVLKKLHNVGGNIEADGIALFGTDDIKIFAPYNDLSNLPELTLHDPPSASAFWESAFAIDDELCKAAADPHARFFDSAFINTLDDGNGNLKSSQKELLLWHHKLSHTNFAKVRLLTKATQWIRVSDIADDALHVDAILPMTHSTPSSQETLDCKCAACLMAKARRKTPAGPSKTTSTPTEMVLKTDDLAPGQCISVDHYVSPTRGRRVDGYGRATHRDGYVGGAVFVDHASSKVFHQPQTDLSASSTIFGKQRVENEAQSCGISVKKYHSDNGVFCSHEFREHCNGQNQDLDFSAPGAKHQNGVAERAIGTLSRMARANLIHLMIHWPQFCDINLWALAMNYAVWVYNRLPKRSLGGLSPNEFWSGSRSDHSDLKRTHVFGCPVYVLDPDLQDGKRIPKWTSRARKGMFVGFSSEHSSQCPLVLNLETGHISPQYHVVFDDKFASVVSLDKSHADVESVFESLHNAGMSELFLDPEEVYGFKAPDGVSDGDLDGAPTNVLDGVSDGASDKMCLDNSRPQRSEQARRPPQRLDPNPTKRAYTLLPIGAAVLPLTSWAQPPAMFANTMKQLRLFHNKVKVSRADLAERSLLRGSWSNEVSAFTAGHCGSQLSLPWVDDDTYWNNASDSEKYSYNATTARVNALILPDLSLPLPRPPMVSSTPLNRMHYLPKLAAMLKTTQPGLKQCLATMLLTTTMLPSRNSSRFKKSFIAGNLSATRRQ